jgi:lysyl-tRNA synthetase class 1
VLLGQEKGPRFGSFVAVYGLANAVTMIDGALARSASEDLVIPPSIEEIIQRLEASAGPLQELTVSEELNRARQALKKPSKGENLGAWAEALAFALSTHRSDSNPWNTYFGPMATMVDAEGKTRYVPDVSGTPAEVLDHWVQRADSLKHPVLKARYADLAWDLAYVIGKRRRDPATARKAIDAYLVSATEQFRPEDHYRYNAIERALDLAILLSDAGRIDAARAAYMALHREGMNENKGSWWRAFDRLLTEKKANLTDAERGELIDDLEKLVTQYSDTSSAHFDPHSTESAAKRLIKVYSREHRGAEVNRLFEKIAKAFEHFAGMSNPMLAAALLQTSIDAYESAGMTEDSKRVRVLMQQKIGESKDEMKSIETEITIQKDDVEKFLSAVVVDDLGSTFVNLAVAFLPKRKALEDAMKKTAEEAPFMAFISQKIMSDDRVTAVIGSVDEDPFGRLFEQAKFNYGSSYVWLLQAFQRLVEKHEALPEHFVGWANRYAIFDDTGLLLEGVRAWFTGDYVKTVHVLVPQIERAVRNIAGQLGKPVTKAHPKVKGASVAINMGDILYSDDITEKLGADLILYLLSVYADPRGLNLRNELAHGQLELTAMTDHTARLLIHTLLVLGLWKELAESYSRTNVQDKEQ